MREEADAAMIARARGDRAAFAEIYDLYVHRLYAFCRTLSASREVACHVVNPVQTQEVTA